MAARSFPPSMLDYIARQSSCLAWNITFKDGSEKEVVFCPKTHDPYEARKWGKLNLVKEDIAGITSKGYIVPGVLVADIVAMIKIEIKQGKVEFAYPYDIKDIDSFNKTEMVQEPLDGDFIAYDSDGNRFSAWATYDNTGNAVRWHDPETMTTLEKLPIPDADAEFLYYRKQAVVTEVQTSGGIARKNSGAYDFRTEGIAVAVRKFRDNEIKRNAKWRNSLLGGYIKYSNEFKPASVRDPRKFYIQLKSGARAFAMIHDNGKTLFSPISHAKITIPDTDIERFLPIDDGAYDARDCYSAREVEEIYENFMKAGGFKDRCVDVVKDALGGLILMLIVWLMGILLRPMSTSVALVIKRLHVRMVMVVLFVSFLLYLAVKLLFGV